MDLSTILAIIALICALGSVHAGVQIANDLRSRGISAKPILVRWMIFHYMAEYRRVTLEESYGFFHKIRDLHHGDSYVSVYQHSEGDA